MMIVWDFMLWNWYISVFVCAFIFFFCIYMCPCEWRVRWKGEGCDNVTAPSKDQVVTERGINDAVQMAIPAEE